MNPPKVQLNENIAVDVAPGTPIIDLFKHQLSDNEYSELLCIKNDRFASVNEPIEDNCHISSGIHFHESHRRAYESAAIVILAYLLETRLLRRDIIFQHSMADGIFCETKDQRPINPVFIETLEKEFRAVVEANIPILPVVLPRRKAIAQMHQRGMADTCALLRQSTHSNFKFYQIDQTLVWLPNPPAGRTGLINLFEIMPYEHGFVIRFPVEGNLDQLQPFHDQKRLYEIFQETVRWGQIIDIMNVGHLNRLVDEKNISDMIKISEALQEKKVAAIADQIHARSHTARLVFISGPSSSGKTTFMKKLYIQLRVLGHKIVMLSLDDYYKDRQQIIDEQGPNPNFEILEALDLDLLNDHLSRLLKGKPVNRPKYDFITGMKTFETKSTLTNNQTIFIIEGIHGINPGLTRDIPEAYKFKIYISALIHINLDHYNRISTHDTRLIRRIVRDGKYRGYGAAQTINIWKKVVEGEKKYIFRHQGKADIMFNSALAYEIGVLRKYADPFLKQVPAKDTSHPEACRLLDLLSYFRPISDVEIPPTSIMREFIGNSSFKY